MAVIFRPKNRFKSQNTPIEVIHATSSEPPARIHLTKVSVLLTTPALIESVRLVNIQAKNAVAAEINSAKRQTSGCFGTNRNSLSLSYSSSHSSSTSSAVDLMLGCLGIFLVGEPVEPIGCV